MILYWWNICGGGFWPIILLSRLSIDHKAVTKQANHRFKHILLTRHCRLFEEVCLGHIFVFSWMKIFFFVSSHETPAKFLNPIKQIQKIQTFFFFLKFWSRSFNYNGKKVIQCWQLDRMKARKTWKNMVAHSWICF